MSKVDLSKLILGSLSAQYWMSGITAGALKKLKFSLRPHLFYLLNENPFSEYSLGAKLKLKVDQF